MQNREPVWITGVGTVNPLGSNFEETTKALLSGVSGVVKVTEFALPDHLSSIAGKVKGIPHPTEVPDETFFQLNRLEQLILSCISQALQQSDLVGSSDLENTALLLGLGAELMYSWEIDRNNGGDRVGTPELDLQAISQLVQNIYGIRGPSSSVAAACASGNYAFAQAKQWLQMGLGEVCIAGAADLFVTPMAMACFGNLRALSRRNDAPTEASRPFDSDRDGFVMGEGGAVFVLETASHARKRGAKPMAELAGFGASSDAFHLVIPSPNPAPAVKAMRAAIKDAKINPEEIDYVNAHATSTPVGDVSETKVLKEVLGERVRFVPISSTKSMTGHLLSGAAAMNATACLVALQEQTIHPTINLHNPDPECNLRHVANQAEEHPVNIAVSNAFGFGGSNTTVVFKKVA